MPLPLSLLRQAIQELDCVLDAEHFTLLESTDSVTDHLGLAVEDHDVSKKSLCFKVWYDFEALDVLSDEFEVVGGESPA